MLSRFIAWRYFRTQRTTHAINLIVYISMMAIALVTAALVVVMSVFNGFEDLVKSLYGDFYADVKVERTSGKTLKVSPRLLQAVEELPELQAWTAVLQTRAVLVNDENRAVAWLKGVSENYTAVVAVDKHLLRGNFAVGDSSNPALILGAGLENALQVQSDRAAFPITLYLPNTAATANANITEAIHSANLIPSGSFALQQEFDNQFAFTSAAFIQYMLGYGPDQFSALELRLRPGSNSEAVAESLQHLLGKGYNVRSRFGQNQALFAAMQMEKLIIFLVAILILVIAAFNIISALTMTVIEKQPDLALLSALGMPARKMRLIFVELSVLMAGVGAAAGLIIGFLITVGQQRYQWVRLGGQSFVIDYYPMSIRWADYIAVALIVVLVALIAGYLPARRIKFSPALLRR